MLAIFAQVRVVGQGLKVALFPNGSTSTAFAERHGGRSLQEAFGQGTPRRRKLLDKSLDFHAAAEKDEGNEFAAPPVPRLVPIAQYCRRGT